MGISSHLGRVLPLAIISWYCFILSFSSWVVLLCEAGSCMDGERRALTKFRNGLNDPLNRLSSWDDHELDCCRWRGITCDNKTGYVIKLDLRNPYDTFTPDEVHKYGYWNLSGQLDQSLSELKHLRYVDFSSNSFDGQSIPSFIGSFHELRYLDLSNAGFQGIIPPQLGNHSKIEYLDLSSNYALAVDNFMWLGKMESLKYLHMDKVDLSRANNDWVQVTLNRLPSLVELHLRSCELSHIPQTLSFINFTSSLQVLDLSLNQFDSMIPNWMANFSNLVSLDLSLNQFDSMIPNWMANFSNLVSLDLSSNRFESMIPNWMANFSNLVSLDLSYNDFSGSITSLFSKHEGRNWRKIERIDLSWNKIQGEIPESIGNLTSLTQLDLSANQISGIIPESIGDLQNLERLDLSWNNVNGGPLLIHLCKLKGLERLLLRRCMLTGSIPPCLGELSFLQSLDLSSNKLSGALPETFGQLSELEELYVHNNSLTGVVSEVNFRNLSKLTDLSMSSNSLTLQFKKDWSPPFQLSGIFLSSCVLGLEFPRWLESQRDSIMELDISNTSISDEVPDWFWETIPQIHTLRASNNKMRGNLPDPLLRKSEIKGKIVDLSSNLFSGPIPLIFGSFYLINLSGNKFSGSLPQRWGHKNFTVSLFMASNNNISGSIPSSIGGLKQLRLLDLSRNKISGKIPATISNCIALEGLDLSENYLHGKIPNIGGNMGSLQVLHLNKNKLFGGIPISLKGSDWLVAIDLGENNLSGNIPAWIGELPNIQRLRLRSNFFFGEIPLQLSNASFLQVLDLAGNMLTGSIPPSFGNLSGMKFQNYTYEAYDFNTRGFSRGSYQYEGHVDNLFVSTKGQILKYTTTLPLVTSLDLSNNNLEGNIPEELTTLVGLRTLDLSGNNFTGKISENISNLNLLESLDLSRNQFSGWIPQSLSIMTSLEHLNLSYNNFSGKIPTGPQLQVLDDPSSYIGNAELCGPPLTKKCLGDIDVTPSDKTNSGNDEGEDMGWLYAGIGPGFATGCSGILLILIFKKSWRINLFRLADALTTRFFPYG